MILHDISDDTNIIEVPATSFGTKWLFERYLHTLHVFFVPCGIQERVSKSKQGQVFDQLLAQVVINSEDLVFLEQRCQVVLQLPRGLQIAPKWLFHDQPGDAVLRVQLLLDFLRNAQEDAGWQGKVEQPVRLGYFCVRLVPLDDLPQLVVALRRVVRTGHVRDHLEELLLLGVVLGPMRLAQVRRDPLLQLLFLQVRARVPEDPGAPVQVPLSVQPKQRWERLFLGEIAGRPKHHDDRVLLEFHRSLFYRCHLTSFRLVRAPELVTLSLTSRAHFLSLLPKPVTLRRVRTEFQFQIRRISKTDYLNTATTTAIHYNSNVNRNTNIINQLRER